MHRKLPNRKLTQQRGVAILTVLVVVALVVTLAALIFARQSRAVRQTDNYQSLERAWQYAFALEQFVGMELQRDQQDNKYDALSEGWATTLPTLPIEEGNGVKVGEFNGKLEDLQARFNLNNVLDEKGKLRTNGEDQQLKELVKLSGLPSGFADTLIDWVDADSIILSGESAESDYYLSGAVPYRAANRAFADASEVRLLRLDITDPKEKEQALANFLRNATVLPAKTPTKINANTATDVVLKAIGLSQNSVDTIAAARTAETPYKTTGDLLAALDTADKAKQEQLSKVLDVSSQYFRLTGEVRLGRARVYVNSVFFRETGEPIRVIMRQFDRVNEPEKDDTTTDDANTTPANT